MPFEVDLVERALKDLNSLEETLRKFVESRLLRLGQSPSTLSRPPVSPPYPPGGMVYEFDYELDETARHHFAVFFRYGSDEMRLIVFAIGYTRLERI
jgi:hypothetical protein